MVHIGIFIDGLIRKFRDRTGVSYEEVSHYVNHYAATRDGENVLSEIGFVILVEAADRRASLSRGLQSGRKVNSQRFGTVIAIGSGADGIIEQVNRLDRSYQYGQSQPPGGRERFPEFEPLMWNLMLLGNLYWAEFASPATNLFAGWGGAYDLIYQDANRGFRYLETYSILLRVYDVDAPNSGMQLLNVLKYERRRDFSFIAMMADRQLDFFGAKDINSPSDAPSQFAIQRDDFTMNSKVHMSLIGVRKGNQLAPPLIVIDGIDSTEESKHMAFTWFDDVGRLVVAINSEFDHWLQQQVEAYCSALKWPPGVKRR